MHPSLAIPSPLLPSLFFPLLPNSAPPYLLAGFGAAKRSGGMHPSLAILPFLPLFYPLPFLPSPPCHKAAP